MCPKRIWGKTNVEVETLEGRQAGMVCGQLEPFSLWTALVWHSKRPARVRLGEGVGRRRVCTFHSCHSLSLSFSLRMEFLTFMGDHLKLLVQCPSGNAMNICFVCFVGVPFASLGHVAYFSAADCN